MYIPTFTVNLQNVVVTKKRLLLQGMPGSGKTYSCVTTAPNPFVADLDDGLTAFQGYNIPSAPFYDHDFVCKYANGIYKPLQATGLKHHPQPNRRDALLHFLEHEAIKFTAEQTLIIDGLTSFEAAISQQEIHEQKRTQKGAIDDFHPWNERMKCYVNFVTFLKALKCHVIVCCHEEKIRDKETGRLLDKTAPLIQGKFIAQIKSHFTDVFRAVTDDIKDPTTGKVIKTNYYWQVRSDNLFDAKTRLSLPDGVVLESPSFEIFSKYKLLELDNPYIQPTKKKD